MNILIQKKNDFFIHNFKTSTNEQLLLCMVFY